MGVVSVGVELKSKLADDVTKRKHIQDKQKGTKNRALRDSMCDRDGLGFAVVHGDVLESIG